MMWSLPIWLRGKNIEGQKECCRCSTTSITSPFDADAVIKNTIFADSKAVLEADFVGKHIGEFADIPATNKQVRVPLCVVYDLENDQIKRGRVYFEMPVLLQQLGVTG
jgi:hypothetical protein